jgi:rubrerythrin
MVTTVGTENAYSKLIANLVGLEHDALAAYESCIERLEDTSRKACIAEFREDHLRHIRELRELAAADGIDVPDEGGMKQMLTTGKVNLASLIGDGAILTAMASNENDTVAAYERARDHHDAPEAARRLFARAHEDELRHRAWMQSEAEAA